ncbi:MAG: M1 family metallopeptidase [Cyclobacteriaceae bacterium]|nr:M1 family metallopeptidase [Cyclobacteriaceae bacterium]
MILPWFSCTTTPESVPLAFISSVDPHSYSRPDEVSVYHIDLFLSVDFEKKSLYGLARIHYNIHKPGAALILDIGKGLEIEAIKDDSALEAVYRFGEEDDILGRSLEIEIEEHSGFVEVHYHTNQDAAALQWLAPEQTHGKNMPFLFTQSQAILARTWIPLQDSPSVRFTYDARIVVPGGMLALMSAQNPVQKNESGEYFFQMKQSIPSYLMALAVGDLTFKELGESTGVYAEPGMLEKAVYEFAETEKMLQVASGLYGDYAWDRYDILLLPPSFPFGGMENPRLTFVTPTILAGDRSLTSLVAHELAHAWSGNLVTNATWNDFWLNEGFTVYFEYRIIEALYGYDYAEMLASISMQDLLDEIEILTSSGQLEKSSLKGQWDGLDPDEGVSPIAYDKGYFFLLRLEALAGREAFDGFLKKYFADHAFLSIDTEYFIEYARRNLSIEWSDDFIDNWVYGQGLPDDIPVVSSNRFNAVDRELKNWLTGKKPNELETENWTSHEWQHFLRQMPDSIDAKDMRQLDEVYAFSESENAEVFFLWAMQAVKANYKIAFGPIETFLMQTGRRKFVLPLFREMKKHQHTAGLAEILYHKARPNYHYVTANAVDALFVIGS